MDRRSMTGRYLLFLTIWKEKKVVHKSLEQEKRG